jgi:hypothetical protein
MFDKALAQAFRAASSASGSPKVAGTGVTGDAGAADAGLALLAGSFAGAAESEAASSDIARVAFSWPCAGQLDEYRKQASGKHVKKQAA